MIGTRVVVAAAVLLLAGCAGGEPAAAPSRTSASPGRTTLPAAADDPAGPEFPSVVPSGRRPVVHEGDDWTLPAWVRPAPYSGFFSESASLPDHIAVRSVDVSWRQIQPTEDGPLDLTSSGDAQGMFFDPLGEQLAEPGPYWVRMFASGVDWAPQWVIDKCGVSGVGTDYDGEQHLPIWDDCVWSALRDTWQRLLVDQGVREDPDFRFAYVPGGFTWVEFDYDVIGQAAQAGLVSEHDYLTWFRQMVTDLVALGGDQPGRLVFTGEDYPWGPFSPADNLLATDAVRAGLGVRTGITEEFDFHLSQTPAYGSVIAPDGHLRLRRADQPSRLQVFGTENECYAACGFHSADPRYVVKMSNLKALQLGMNWVYVVPGDSLLDVEPELWDWVRLSLGQRPATAPDAWAALRDAEDTYWRDGGWPRARPWRGRPFVRNLERWLVQVDTRGAIAHRASVDVHRGDPTRENGVAYEGLSTEPAAGDRSLAFRVDPRFLPSTGSHRVLVKVTYLDAGSGDLGLRYGASRAPAVRLRDSGTWRTATWALPLTPDHSMPGHTDLWLDGPSATPLTVRFVRVVRLDAPE